ncbi:MAG TPA: hypothetical protein VFH39_01980, partial [Candidatus Saccharimonadales bacterium]|nr:hypothetical protein [Candidatus Saccharimonadales bacterium]
EVLIALAILGSAFGIAYATANKGLTAARNSEEHSQALQYINQQIELLRSAVHNTDAATAGVYSMTGKAFCLKEASPVQVVPFTSGWIPANEPADTDVQNASTNYRPECSKDGLYYYSITYTPGTNEDIFQVLVRWQGIGMLGPQQESSSYKMHAVN